MICLTPKPSQSFFVYRIQSKTKCSKRAFLRERGGKGLKKKRKEGFLTAKSTMIWKDPTMSIRKRKELKTVRTVIKQDLKPHCNPIWLRYSGRFRKQNKCNFPSKYWIA